MSVFTDPASSAPGRFGEFGGRFVPETLIAALDELDATFSDAVADRAFWSELETLWRDFVGRESLPRHSFRAAACGPLAMASARY